MEDCDGLSVIALTSAALATDSKPFFSGSVLVEDLDDIIGQGLMPPEELEINCRATLGCHPGQACMY